MNIDGVAAIVTGGASGLGASTAERLARAGAKVTIFDLNAELGTAKAAELGGHFVAVNVTDEDAVRAAIAEAEGVHGKARILVNCAGIGPPAKVLNRDGSAIALADFAKIVTINLIGTFNVISKFAERLHTADLLGEERGVIISTASVAAYEGQIGQAAYAASKGGVVGMTLPIAREFARFGIRVMTIAPGIFWTPMVDTMPPQVQESLSASIPYPSRLGKPEEFAETVAFILRTRYLNGETIRLDGAVRLAPK